MSELRLILLLKISIGIGLCLLLLGIYLQFFSDYMQSLGIKGIIISVILFTLGLILSLPTKMYLTIVLMKREAESKSQLTADKNEKTAPNKEH